MLEQQVVFVSGSANASKDCTAHELVNIGSEAIDDLEPKVSRCSRNLFKRNLGARTSWSSHRFSWGICPLAPANGSVEYLNSH